MPCGAQIRFGSLEDVFRYADQNEVSIKNARDRELIAASQSSAAKTALLPTLNASAGFNDNLTLQPTLVPANLFNPAAPAGTYNEFTFGRQYQYSTGVQAGWDVLNFQKWFEVRTTRAAQILGEANTRYTRFQVYNTLAQTYYSILLTEQYNSIARRNTLAVDSIYRIALERYKSGVFTEENRNRSQIQYLQARQQEAGLAASLEQLYNQLQAQMNTTESLVLTETFSMKLPDTSSVVENTTLHPLVQVQQAQLELNQRQLAQTRTLHYPNLSVGYQYNHNRVSDKMFDLSSSNTLPQQFWGLKLTIPVFNGFATREKVRQAEVQLRLQQRVADNQLIKAQKEDDNLKSQLRRHKEEVRQNEAILQLQTDNDRHTQNRYESGIIGLDERLDKFRDLLTIQNQYIQSLSNYYISYYQHYLRTHL